MQNPCYTRQVPNKWLRGQAVKTLASHAGIRGSIPLGVISEEVSERMLLFLLMTIERLQEDNGFCQGLVIKISILDKILKIRRKIGQFVCLFCGDSHLNRLRDLRYNGTVKKYWRKNYVSISSRNA